MSLDRAIRRNAERKRLKAERVKADDMKTWSEKEIARNVGVKVDTLLKWQEEREKELSQGMAEKMAEILWDAENYIASANVIIFLYAVKMTFGELKTVQRGMNKLVRNLGAAMDYVDRTGIKKAYEEITKEFGIYELEFEDFDLNKLFENPGKAKLMTAKLSEKIKEETGDES